MKKILHFLFIISLIYTCANAQTYCTTGLYDPANGCTNGVAINDFSLANIHQTATGCSGQVADYTSLTVNLSQGESYLFKAVSSSTYPGSEYLGIWVDLNDNGSFEDQGELFYTSAEGNALSGILTVPGTALLGNHRMRVRLKYDYTYLNYGPITLTNSCTYYLYGEAHDYTVNISAPPSCTGLSSLSVSKIKKFSATVNWGCGGCTGPFIVEYGLPGFTPGTGNTAGTGGTVINAASSPTTLSGLLSNTEYEIYVRRKCGTSDFSLNFGPVKFRTVYDACGTLQTITCNQVIAETVSIGKGEFDYYPNTGSFLEGKEKIYQFTPTVTGKYVLSVSNTNYITAYYFLKEASLGCDRYSWKQIGGAYSAPSLILMGTLTAGTTYYLMLETYGTSFETQQEFKIECASDYNPCPGIESVTCATPITFVIDAGTGKFDVPMILSQWDQVIFQGKEKIFSYTPASSGKIRLKVGSPDYTYSAGFFIKNSSDGCNSNNWISMGYSTGFSSYYSWYSQAVEVTAGNTYYIMCDALSLEGRSLNMEISCPETWEPCTSILPVTCGVPVSADIPAGLGKFDLPIFSNQCGYSTLPGKELIYSFTPSQTGYYKIDVTASEYKRVNYMIKEAGTCNGDNWLCMGGAVSSTSFLTPVSLSAGHTYYILLDAEEVTTGTLQTFTIDCATLPDPCSSITPIVCGQSLDISIPNGLSFFSPYLPYNGEMRGKEKIVQFTPSTTGTYFLRITNRTGYSGTYAIKPASDGCTINNWETIYQNYYNNTCLIPMQLVAGTAYYILVENQYGQYGYGEVNETMEIVCPSETYNPCATITTITGCGSSVTSNNAAGVGSYVTSSSFFNYGSGIAGPAGKENIYQFTPSVTGRYILKTTAGTGEVSFAIKEASGGCNGFGWTYIGNAGGQWYYYPTNFPIPIKLIAGTSYYILVDANDIIGASSTFELICPENYDPCQNIRQLTCGNADHYTNVETIAGFGNTFLNSCGRFYNNTVGKEIIYEFTASGNGSQIIEAISNFSFTGFIKKSSLGCGPDDWTCIGSAGSYVESWITPDLTEGEKYLLMVIPGGDYGNSNFLLTLVLHCNSGCKVYADADDDGYGDPNRTFTDCWSVFYGYSANDNDCNDANENIHPGAEEICGNHIDDDCDGFVDEDCPCNNITLTITASDVANNFCNGVEYSVTSSSEIQSYNWSTGATTPTLFLTTANTAGNYSVTIHDVNGCPATANFNYNPQLFTSSYTVLAKQGIKLQSNNTVVNGSVGVVNAGGSASMKKNVSIAGTGAFLKADNITTQLPVNIPAQIPDPATTTLPTMQYNTTSTSGLPNVTVPNSTTVTITGNCKNVTIGNNCNVTLTGNIFGAITIGSGSSAFFTQSSIDVTAITMNAGTVSANTQLKFSGDAIVRCAGSILMNTRSIVNPDNRKVIIYLGKISGAPVTFTVAAGGNETVNASMYIPSGKISVGGDAIIMTYMNGKFIAENIETLDKNVIWNWYDCAAATTAPLIVSRSAVTVAEQKAEPVTGLNVKAWPNPSDNQFTIKVESNRNETVELKVYDMVGRVVYSATGNANRQYQFGNNFVSGAYVAEVRQGAERKTVKLIKQ